MKTMHVQGVVAQTVRQGAPQREPEPAETRTPDEELTDLQRAFRERAAREAERFADATDSEFFVVLCFPRREAKDAHIEAAGWTDLGDKYLDGVAALERLGVRVVGLRDKEV